MLPRRWLQLACMNMAVNQLTLPRQGRVAGPAQVAGVEGGMRGRRVEVRKLVEDPHDEVRRDEQRGDDGEAAGRMPSVSGMRGSVEAARMSRRHSF